MSATTSCGRVQVISCGLRVPVPHAFWVESTQARLLVVATPAGFEQFFFDTGEPAAALTVPPPAAAPPDLDALVAALADHGVDVLAPPPTPTEA